MLVVSIVLGVVSLLLAGQSLYALMMMLFAWRAPMAGTVPSRWSRPELSFTVIVPARHEEAVIAQTITKLAQLNYPRDMIQIVVVLSDDDTSTIDVVAEAVDRLYVQDIRNVEIAIFNDRPINKPHGLNVALARAKNNVVVIFDAEDDMHPDIINLMNTVMVQEGVRVVQAGVQLMNFDSNWYSSFNVVEYVFHFKSRMHMQAKNDAVLLGGNTVAIDRILLESNGGWDDHNLTEDAELGIRLSARGERVRVAFDPTLATREETPPTLKGFVKQRTRWSQGFGQCLRKGVWRELPTRKQRLLAWYALSGPRLQALLGLYIPFALAATLWLHAPVMVALISWAPVMLLAAHLVVTLAGLYEFAEWHGVEVAKKRIAIMILTWYPYQLLLAYAAINAWLRQARGDLSWDKTTHTGAHR